jgi:hypothetical protein
VSTVMHLFIAAASKALHGSSSNAAAGAGAASHMGAPPHLTVEPFSPASLSASSHAHPHPPHAGGFLHTTPLPGQDQDQGQDQGQGQSQGQSQGQGPGSFPSGKQAVVGERFPSLKRTGGGGGVGALGSPTSSHAAPALAIERYSSNTNVSGFDRGWGLPSPAGGSGGSSDNCHIVAHTIVLGGEYASGKTAMASTIVRTLLAASPASSPEDVPVSPADAASFSKALGARIERASDVLEALGHARFARSPNSR